MQNRQNIADKTLVPNVTIFFELPPNSGHLSITEKFFNIRKCALFRGFTVRTYEELLDLKGKKKTHKQNLQIQIFQITI